jgi:quercetin dioxygenase-like cupin family protein
MNEVFPEFVRDLPEVNIPIPGLKAYLLQGPDHQMLFMEFHEDVEVPPHAHEAQWGVVLQGQIELEIDGVARTYRKGGRMVVPRKARHSAKVHAGYADITFFDQKDRYRPK